MTKISFVVCALVSFNVGAVVVVVLVVVVLVVVVLVVVVADDSGGVSGGVCSGDVQKPQLRSHFPLSISGLLHKFFKLRQFTRSRHACGPSGMTLSHSLHVLRQFCR